MLAVSRLDLADPLLNVVDLEVSVCYRCDSLGVPALNFVSRGIDTRKDNKFVKISLDIRRDNCMIDSKQNNHERIQDTEERKRI